MSEKITKDMTFAEILQVFPQAGPILGKYGLHCIGCHIAAIETLEQGCKAHGLDDSRIEDLVNELNEKAQ